MASLKAINSQIWGISTVGFGVIVEGIASIRQCLDLIIRTTKGTDALRAEFGSNVLKYIDYPLNIAIPNIKKEILNAVDIWEKRVRIISISHYLKEPEQPIFEITYRLLDENIIDKLLFDLQQSTVVSDTLNEVILQAFFPSNPHNYRYQVIFNRNGSSVFPMPYPSGYISLHELFTWIQNNWSFIGRWHLISDRIVCYMNTDGIKSVSLSIEVLPIIRFEADFPQLIPGEKYSVTFTVNGAEAIPKIPASFVNPGEILSWVQTYWSNYAEWLIEFLQPDGNAIFSDEFSDEFEVPTTGYRLIGVSNVEGFIGSLLITNVP